MRIVAGKLKGKRLVAPAGLATRPTSDRARESLFNILEHAPWSSAIANTRVLDLFAGTGALGIEAMSRGADFACFVETDEAARGALRTNLEACALFGQTRLIKRDACDLGRRPPILTAPFDLVLLDPPYGLGLGERALAGLLKHDWLAPNALCVLEVGAQETPVLAGYELLDERIWGAAKVVFARAP